MATIIRKDWDTYFMDIAFMASTRSRCSETARRGGARSRQKTARHRIQRRPDGRAGLLGSGLHDRRGMASQEDAKNGMKVKQRCIRTIHAEQNLLLFTDRTDREGSTVYVTDQPCWTCANMLANSGIAEIVFHRDYPKDL